MRGRRMASGPPRCTAVYCLSGCWRGLAATCDCWALVLASAGTARLPACWCVGAGLPGRLTAAVCPSCRLVLLPPLPAGAAWRCVPAGQAACAGADSQRAARLHPLPGRQCIPTVQGSGLQRSACLVQCHRPLPAHLPCLPACLPACSATLQLCSPSPTTHPSNHCRCGVPLAAPSSSTCMMETKTGCAGTWAPAAARSPGSIPCWVGSCRWVGIAGSAGPAVLAPVALLVVLRHQ
jgi:hypothetical protein